VKCQDPVVENGRLVAGFKKEYDYKAKVVFECLEGFKLKGNSTIFCGANNVWEPEMPECIKDACDDPPRFESMMLKGTPKSIYHSGDKIEYQCHLGYKHVLPFLATSAICQSDNTWTHLREACTIDMADSIDHFSCVELLLHSRNKSHLFMTYYLHGTKVLYCEHSGDQVDWSDNPPQCEKILCQPPGEISNGKYTDSHKAMFEYNEVVTYSCNPSKGPDEYSLIGESRLACSGHNVWSSDPPHCRVVKCENPVLKKGKLVSGFKTKYYYKAKVVFECLKGFYLKGSNTIFCDANSIWEPAMPECIKGTKSVFFLFFFIFHFFDIKY
ncbi:membrane cofactor protein-like, partial [Pteropus alecto]|uniref:membrane cofactor protein-like n=1 Tax=Pteropus alecto TaxID=9402 RepID=UPI0007688072